MTTGDLIKARRKEIAMSAERLAEKVEFLQLLFIDMKKGTLKRFLSM